MKILPVGLMAAAFSLALLLPATRARAQDWPDDEEMQSDAYSIQRGRQELHHDYRELGEDVQRGDYGAAAHEQAEIARRRYNLQRRQQDLNNDFASRYYNDDDD
jgi:hypothetical protein